jgi:glycosyltransferase involved in cell wall biosynthesis
MFSKFLPKFGWKPFILTSARDPSDPRYQPTMIIEGLPPDSQIMRVIHGTDEEATATLQRNSSISMKLRYLFYPDYAHPPGLLDKMLNETVRLLGSLKFDVIYATYDPLASLTLGAYLSAKLHIPWIADFRDIHEQDLAENFRMKLLQFRWSLRRKILTRKAAAIITVSRNHAAVLGEKLNRHVHVIPNGFDPTTYHPIDNHHSTKFTITYMGRILFQWLRNPEYLLQAIDILLEHNDIALNDLDVSFYGTDRDVLLPIISQYKCRSCIKVHPRVPYNDVPGILQQSCVLLLLTEHGRKGILTTKAFEYMATKRPILCVPNDHDELEQLLNKTKSGISCGSAEETASIIKEWYNEWKITGTIQCNSDDKEVREYSREKQTGQLAALLESVCK